jgi:hypothetical protein
MKRLLIFVLTMLVLPAVSGAADHVVEKPIAADTPERFSETVKQVHNEMQVGGRYEFISAADKTKAEADMDSMASMLKTVGSVAAMNEQDKIRLFNTQEHLNGILTHSDSNRLVCERKAPIGSNIPLTTCHTVAEIENARHRSQNEVRAADGLGDVCRLQAQCNSGSDGIKAKAAH